MKISIETGIEQILYEQSQVGEKNLPENINTLLPSEEHVNHELDKVFSATNLDDYLLALAKPEITNSDVLKPDVFHRLFSQLPDILDALSEDMDPECQQDLNNAAVLLKEEKDLINLLNLYRNLLVKS